MATKYHQISLNESFSDCQNQFLDDAPSFFLLLSEYFDINDFIPIEFYSSFYQSLGRTRIYPLQGFLSAFILQKFFSITTDALLLLLLNICKELRQFCGFSKVPDASLMSRFKHDFEAYIERMFQQMVDYTEPICQAIDASLAQTLTFDTSGIELYVTENNPKTLNAHIKKLKAYYKDKPHVDPYKMAYGLMPSQAASCPDAKQMYSNGHFCYADKFAILTNGLGIVRHITFQNQHVYRRKKDQKSYHHQSRRVPGWYCKPAYPHRCLCYELSTIHSKSQTFSCLKKYSIVVILIWAYKSTPKI